MNDDDEFQKNYIFLAIQFKQETGLDFVLDNQGLIGLFLNANGKSMHFYSVDRSYSGLEEARLFATTLSDEYVKLLADKYGIEFSPVGEAVVRQLKLEPQNTDSSLVSGRPLMVRRPRLDELLALQKAIEYSEPSAYQPPGQLPTTIVPINDTLIEGDLSGALLKYMEDGRPVLFLSPPLCQQGRPTVLDSIDTDESESWQASNMLELAWKTAVDCNKFPLNSEEYEALGWVPIKSEQAAGLFALKSEDGLLYRAYDEATNPDQAWARCNEDGQYLNTFGQPAIQSSEIAFLTVAQMATLAEVDPCSEHFFNAEEEIVNALSLFRQSAKLRASLNRKSPTLYAIAKTLDQESIDRRYTPVDNHSQFLRAADGRLVAMNCAGCRADLKPEWSSCPCCGNLVPVAQRTFHSPNGEQVSKLEQSATKAAQRLINLI